jgi:hypothetical protein
MTNPLHRAASLTLTDRLIGRRGAQKAADGGARAITDSRLSQQGGRGV